MIELSLPSGCLENAVYSFLGGADSVYFGLKDFSARKGAVNFSISDFKKIRHYAKEHNKKIYITINTLIKDSELEKVFDTLKEIEKYGCDGIIVQDYGIMRMLRNYFPSLSLHASTQAAIHTDYGVKAMKMIGCKRAVLSRELSIDEIKKIREKNKDIELKVFIHGAMCYGFSGLCMASFYKTGRSANRGECAQMCRTWFTIGGEKIFPFSMKDMDAGEKIKALKEINIDSVKVEGRMKGNEYDYYTALYYRALIDGNTPDDRIFYTFHRESSDGYLSYKGPGHNKLITDDYTSHKGKEIGSVTGQNGKKVKVSLTEEIKDRDGLMFLLKDGPYKFSAKVLGRNEIILPDDIQIGYGMPLYKISDSSMNLKKINTEAMKEERERIDAVIKIDDEKISINDKSYPISTQKAEKDQKDNVIRALEQSQSDKELKVISYENNKNLFVKLSEIKEARRAYLESFVEKDEKRYKSISEKQAGITLPDRNLLDGENYPWNEDGILIDGVTYITLCPITFDEEKKYRKLEERLKEIDTPVMIGLNNAADLYYASKHPENSYFIDVYLNTTNAEATALFKDILKDSLKGIYASVEVKDGNLSWPVTPTLTKDYTLPYFISRSCFRHDSLKKECTSCNKKHKYEIEQNGKLYDVLVDNCMTVVKEKSAF